MTEWIRYIATTLVAGINSFQAVGTAVTNYPKVNITAVRHIQVCYSKSTYCGWPRQCGIVNLGNGEIVVLHRHTPSAYKTSQDISHSAVHERSVVLLQRSTDAGETWPKENEIVRFCSSAAKKECHSHSLEYTIDMRWPSD